MKRLTAGWVRKAEADVEGARKLAQARPPLPDPVCFHCQQAAEKYLKALAQEWRLAVPRTHNLDDLLNLLLPHEATLRGMRRGLVALSRYAVDYSIAAGAVRAAPELLPKVLRSRPRAEGF
jgi:HEPN domain-containing protein